MSHTSISVLGDSWFRVFSQFRLNPETFFDRKKITREAFYLDVLRDIYSDRIDIQCKVCLMLLLQEHSSTLIKDSNSLEQIVGSLVNLFNTSSKNTVENRLLKSHILIAVSTILLTSDIDGIKELISSVKKLLLGLIFDGSEDYIVISSACKCLEEMEMYFPNILENEMKRILSACERHFSPAFQNYALLLSLCMKNMSLKYYNEKMLPDQSETFEYEKNKTQVQAVVLYLMELVPLMSPMCVYRMLKNLILVDKYCDISAMAKMLSFQFSLPKLIFSSDVSYFHLAFDFLEVFGSEFFTAEDERCLLTQLILLSTHPCLTMSHRMLFLDWLKSCLLSREKFSCSFPMLKSLLPGPFDGPITQEKKSCILALYLSKYVDKNLGLDILDESISGLKKCALLPHGTKAAASYFRALYVYLSHHNSEFMQNYVYKLLLVIIKTSPHLLPYALSFLDSVKMEFPKSTLPKEALTHLVDHILSLPLKQLMSNLECYLAILEQASEICGSECKPRSILRLLQKILADSDSYQKNVWEFGNNLLSVCQSILMYHDIQLFYYDLAEVLCLISQNVADVDVKDRAKIYYSALTSLSKLKIQSTFKMQSPKKDLKNPLTSFVPGVNTNLQFAPCIQVLTKSILQLVRSEKNCDIAFKDTTKQQSVSNIDILKVYKQHLKSSDSVVQIPFILKHVSIPEKSFSSLYGVVVTAQSSPPCKEISAVEIPVIRNSETNEENLQHFDIIPYESQPFELQFKIEFTCSNGYNYICHPNPIFLNFEDFFLPLPVPNALQNHDVSWKKELFEILWEEFQKDISLGSKEVKCCKSAHCLKVSKEKFSLIIKEHWKQFIVEKFHELKYWIAIFLPPKSHLLMKIDTINEKPFINIAVDDMSILPWIGLYLQKITHC